MMTFKRHAGIYTLHLQQQLSISLDEAWSFFANPVNLEKITPPHMKFKITSEHVETMYAGQIITYSVSPMIGYTTNWVTEIKHVNEKHYFVDEQRCGPYKMWHHEHHFEETKQGVLMTDQVSYKIPFGFIGQLAQHLFVKKQLKKIFNHRYVYLAQKFNT